MGHSEHRAQRAAFLQRPAPEICIAWDVMATSLPPHPSGVCPPTPEPYQPPLSPSVPVLVSAGQWEEAGRGVRNPVVLGVTGVLEAGFFPPGRWGFRRGFC